MMEFDGADLHGSRSSFLDDMWLEKKGHVP